MNASAEDLPPEGSDPKGTGPREVRRQPRSDLVFVGGTGRSGTHLVAKLIGRHAEFENVPIEVRFHADPGGFPDLLAGRVRKEQFLRRLRGFWWRRYRSGGRPPDILPWLALGREPRGLHKFVDEDEFEAAAARFDERFDAEPEAACRELFEALLRPLAHRAEKPGLVEMSCATTVAAPALARIFPDALFIHVVRDGRDASASRVRQGRGLLYPRTRVQGVRWWEGRVRRIEAALAELPSDRVLTLSLDWLVQVPPNRRGYKLMRRFLGIEKQKTADTMFKRKVNPGRANVGRWRRGLSEDAQAKVRAEYEAALERLEADGLVSAPLLREIYRFEGRQVGSEQTGLAEANVAHGGGGAA
ncbi:MAG TPA: sulfotransferase [Solirubrobacterales bacterium]